jgi:hypothetical protein
MAIVAFTAPSVSNLNAMLRTALIVTLVNLTSPVMAIDLEGLWDFNNPALSEQRFQAALASANPDDSLILQTQIART